MRSSTFRKAIFISLLLVLPGNRAQGAGPVFWEISKQSEILKGDASGVSIAENGSIRLAPTFTSVYDTKEAYIWSSATDSAGNIYLGTGHEGRVFKVEPSGAGRLLYDSAELDVTALATDSQGNLYAGTSPEGKIYKITPGGSQSVFYDPTDKYIWSLVYDPASSTLYAGTGDKGVIYKIDAEGKAAKLTDTNETNIVSLAVDKSGGLLAGTDPSGLVLRVAADGKTFALFDSPLQEIHSLAVAPDGSTYALGISQQASAQRQAGIGVSSSTTLSSEGTITISTSDDAETVSSVQSDLSAFTSQGQGQSRGKADGARSAVFRLSPDGGNDVYWRSNDTVGFGLRPLSDGRVLVGTSNKGRIYSIAPDRSNTLLIQSPEDQTSTIIAVGDNLFATSSNLGRLYRIGRQAVGEGTYVSSVHDTKFAGQWGIINWRGSGNVELQTRSGNTERPDATWSEWSTPYRNAAGDQITSPRARFIQWRATLRSGVPPGAQSAPATQPARPAARPARPEVNLASGRDTNPATQTSFPERTASSTELDSVVIAYLPRNQAPEVSSVTVLPSGIGLQEMPLAVDPSIASSGLDPQLFGVVTSVPPRRFFQKGARSLTWQATDANNDSLVYKLFYRTAGDNDWHLLAENLTQAYYTIDGNRLPDGSYIFRVQASDAPSNPAPLALTHEETTDAIEMDNTPPAIKVNGPSVSGQTAEITFEVTDSTSRVVRGEYSIDGAAWQLIFPVDGIADSAREGYRVKATFDKEGEHVIAFRSSDSSGNVGTSKVTVTAR